MSHNNVKVSVIIPTHNRKAELINAIESARNQTEANIEILVCDDGSSDGTEEIVRGVMSTDTRIKYFNCGQNGWPAIPRNIGMKNALGEWIAFLDDDDVWNPTKIEAQLFMLHKYNVKACCTNAFFYEGGVNTGKEYFKNSVDDLFLFRDFISVNPVICSSMIIHRSLLEKCIGFPGDIALKSVGEDYAFWCRLLPFTRILYIHYPLVGYMKTSNTSIRKEKQFSFKEQRRIVFGDLKEWINETKYDVKKYYYKEYLFHYSEHLRAMPKMVLKKTKYLTKRILNVFRNVRKEG